MIAIVRTVGTKTHPSWCRTVVVEEVVIILQPTNYPGKNFFRAFLDFNWLAGVWVRDHGWCSRDLHVEELFNGHPCMILELSPVAGNLVYELGGGERGTTRPRRATYEGNT